MIGKEIDPNKLTRSYQFFGVDNNVFCIKIGRTRRAFEVVEDENDGYRSSMENLTERDPKDYIFSTAPIAHVRVRESTGAISGWELYDNKGHVWLTFGTDYTDDYYPSFAFDYQPKLKEAAK